MAASFNESVWSKPSQRRKFLAALIVVILAFATITTFLILFQIKSFEFDAAKRCASTASTDCLVARTGKVEALTTDSDSKKTTESLTVSGYGPITFSSANGDGLPPARIGDTVSVLSWHGAAMEIQEGTTITGTSSDPDFPAQRFLGSFSMSSGVLVAMLILFAIRHPESTSPSPLRKSARIYVLWAMMTGEFTGMILLITPRPGWALIPVSLSAIVAVLIAVEFLVLGPRIAARDQPTVG